MRTKFDLAHRLYSCFEHKMYALVLKDISLYNTRMVKRSTAIVALSLLLISCQGRESSEAVPTVSGARSAIFSLDFLESHGQGARPSASLGIIVSSYLAEELQNALSALSGLDSLLKILSGQGDATSDETFALLQEVGGVLTVNIVDELNRSSNRQQTLDSYLATLKNARDIATRRIQDLRQAEEELSDQQKELQSERRTLRREVKTTLKNKEYGAAGQLQEKLTNAEGRLAEIKAKENQTEDILGRFEELLEVAEERIQAIEKNREILLSGLKVIPVPGIEDLMILEENGRYRRSRR